MTLHQANIRAPGARALYLGARDKKSVTCTDAALVVRNEKRQTLRYPLQRISRVVSSTVADWSGQALALCLQNGIGITWMDGRGNAVGTCYPQKRQHPSFAAAVEMLTETPEGLARYHNWLRARRMEVLMRWGKSALDAIPLAQWEATKREWVYGRRFVVHLPLALLGHCQAWVGAQLAEHGLQPQLWGPDAQPVDLDHDICELLWAEINLCAGSVADNTCADEPVTTLFERWNASNGGAVMLHIHSLYRTAVKTAHQGVPA